ncbi:calponin homology domain-containing protein DDB_G0272472-like [Liolophura sinensis]|uniref:calponin homology domain-containing protein DDB_G0272472-like n=1 Tax=Liolophura sinensis TaxID=3198878 RepID=UPI0031583005
MVLTDLPFERNSRLQSRYDLIRPAKRPDSAPPKHRDRKQSANSKKSSEEYAGFLKFQERSVGPNGFLDSSRYCHSFTVKSKRKTSPGPTGVPQSLSAPTSVSLSARINQDSRDYDKRMKVIEDHMWKHKQEERELKRAEGDIIKNQQAVRHSLRNYENLVNRKRRAEDKKLSKGQEKYVVMQRENTHAKEELTKRRIQHNINMEQELKDVDRKCLLKEMELRRKYQTKKSELELKRVERARISQEFETKMKTKEEEEYKLQKELADLAIGLNMEVLKHRQEIFDKESQKEKEVAKNIEADLANEKSLNSKISKGDGDIKEAELTKRKLSADLSKTRAHIAIKTRDEHRRLTDTQMRLTDNVNTQRQLNDAARFADMDLRAKKIEQRLQAHNERRQTQLSSRISQKRDREEAQQAILQEKFRKRYNEQRRKEHEDSLKFFQKMVSKGEETEQNLYNKVRNAEYARQKQEQTIKHLQLALQEIKRENAEKIKKELADSFRHEKECEEKLLREKAELDKAHAQREESYMKLQHHRTLLKEDRYQLEEHKREHERLTKIGLKSDLTSDSFIYT